MAEKSGPEKFATPDRRSSEKLIDVDEAAANAFEGETREFVRRDVSVLHRQRSEVDAANDPTADSLNTLVRRIAGASMEEIERVILELQGVRDTLAQRGRTRQPGGRRLRQPEPRGNNGDEGLRRQHQAMEKRGGQAGPALGELTLQTAACSEPPAKRQNMTFGLPINMRANGVRTLAA